LPLLRSGSLPLPQGERDFNAARWTPSPLVGEGWGEGYASAIEITGTSIPAGIAQPSVANLAGSTRDAAEAQILDLEELLDAVFRALAPEPAFLDAAEGRHFGRDDALVDADDAVFEGFGHPPHAIDVAAVEIGGEAEFRVVGHLDRLGLGLETEERRHRTESLLARHLHGGGDIGEDGRLVEAAAQRVPVAADDHARALFERVADMLLDLLDRLHVDERADHRAGLGAGAHLHRLHRLGELAGERLIDAILDQQAIGADAGLPGVAVFGGDRPFDRSVEIGVVEDDE